MVYVTEIEEINNTVDADFLEINTDGVSKKLSIGRLFKSIKDELGFYNNPLKKCQHCRQWGAVMCSCVKCGAPIDPQKGFSMLTNLFSWIDRITLDEDWIWSCMYLARNGSFYHKPFNTTFEKKTHLRYLQSPLTASGKEVGNANQFIFMD